MEVKKRHDFYFGLARIVLRLPFRIIYGYSAKRYKLKKDKSYLILSNHTAQADAVMLSLSFDRAIYFIAQDGLLKQKYGKILYHMFAPIAKPKGKAEAFSIRESVSVVKQGGVVGLYASGNCTFNGVESEIDRSIVKFIRLLRSDLILYNNDGMFGIAPRFSAKRRRGRSYGYVVKEVPFEEIKGMSDDELYKLVCDNLYVDAVKQRGNRKFKSKHSAEFLERAYYVCPTCRSLCTISSNGQYVTCSHCGYKAKYGEDLMLHTENGTGFSTLKEWDDFQKEYIKTYVPKDNEPIFTDTIRVVEWHEGEGVDNVTKTAFEGGRITLYPDRFTVEKDGEVKTFDLEKLKFSFQGRWNLLTYYDGMQYYIYGVTPFNGVKYVEMLKRLKTLSEDNK